jgi:uncharacterized protein YciI
MPPKTQPAYYIVFLQTKYASLDEVRRTAGEILAEHLSRSKALHEAGKLVMAGAFLDHPEQPLKTMAILVSKEAADEYVAGDPFVHIGMVSSSEVRVWANMFAAAP